MKQLVIILNNQVVVGSREIAERFGKWHVEVLDKIRDILSVENSANEFSMKSHILIMVDSCQCI